MKFNVENYVPTAAFRRLGNLGDGHTIDQMSAYDLNLLYSWVPLSIFHCSFQNCSIIYQEETPVPTEAGEYNYVSIVLGEITRAVSAHTETINEVNYLYLAIDLDTTRAIRISSRINLALNESLCQF